MSAYKIVKTNSHRMRDRLVRYAPGTVGPYWVGKNRANPNPFEKVGAEFWLIPVEECTRLVTSIKGINFPVAIEVGDLNRNIFGSKDVPHALSVVA